MQHTCEAGTCTATASGSCINGAGAVQCANCSNNTYSNENRTACVACAGVGEYVENRECKSCSTEYNENYYIPVRLSGNTGEAMCGLKLNTSVSVCSSESDVKWYLSNGNWTLVSGSVAYVGLNGYVKDLVPTSPVGQGADVDWCSQCASGTFNMSGGTGEDSCGACPAGYCTSGNNCLPCEAGYYCPATNGVARECAFVSGGHGRVCEQESNNHCSSYLTCPKGSFSGEAKSSCTYCALGYTTDSDATAYNTGDDLSSICKKLYIKLKVNDIDTPIFQLPACLTEGKINKTIIEK